MSTEPGWEPGAFWERPAQNTTIPLGCRTFQRPTRHLCCSSKSSAPAWTRTRRKLAKIRVFLSAAPSLHSRSGNVDTGFRSVLDLLGGKRAVPSAFA